MTDTEAVHCVYMNCQTGGVSSVYLDSVTTPLMLALIPLERPKAERYNSIVRLFSVYGHHTPSKH